MRLKSALRRGVAAAVIAGIVVSSGIPAYAARWDIAKGDITVRADDEGKNRVTQGEKENVEDTDTVIINEVNTLPGFTPISMYPQMWAAAGVSYSDLLTELLTEAAQRPLGLR